MTFLILLDTVIFNFASNNLRKQLQLVTSNPHQIPALVEVTTTKIPATPFETMTLAATATVIDRIPSLISAI